MDKLLYVKPTDQTIWIIAKKAGYIRSQESESNSQEDIGTATSGWRGAALERAKKSGDIFSKATKAKYGAPCKQLGQPGKSRPA